MLLESSYTKAMDNNDARSAILDFRRRAAGARDQRDFATAQALLEQALGLDDQDADAHAELGLTLALAGRAREAIPAYQAALRIRPHDAFAWSNLGAAFLSLHRPKEAETCFRGALQAEPDQPAALQNLAAILKESGRALEAQPLFRRAGAVGGGLDAWLQGYVALSPILPSAQALAAQRAAFEAGVETLAGATAPRAYDGGKIGLPWFYLAYHGLSDRPVLEQLADAVTHAGAPAPSPFQQNASTASRARIRIGFCSEFLSDHTIGRLFEGLIENLDRTRFEVVVAHGVHAVRDAMRSRIDELADQTLTLPKPPEAARQALRDLHLDVLIFTDLGMSAQTWFLALERHAPIQVTTWGHPDTSGMPNVDYFLSSDLIEPPDADKDYRERLIRLSRLPACYARPSGAPQAPRSAFGLPEDTTLYGCPQSLFKIHPEFDAVLAQIVAADPESRIVMVQARNPAWMEVLRTRWRTEHPHLPDKVLFLPRMSPPTFLAHLGLIDVLLDPPHFGSGNTLYEAMFHGTPIVTWPGAHMRGRIVEGAYRQMEVATAPIAATLEAYAQVAVELGRDVIRRRSLREDLRSRAAERLFSDLGAVRDLEAFLTAAMQAHRRGERLPSGWRPHLAAP
jgi:predicted O-linked N-acetylglucosamine transferase (SPINDLY family)